MNKIPERMLSAIHAYIDGGVIPGGFLRAVICNNMREACCLADEENLQNLPAYVKYFYNNAPGICWGSKERMRAWVTAKEEARNQSWEDGTQLP